jgi:uncharacterized protein (TIGR00255 family)
MLISMTGYGRASISSRYGKFTIEIQSLNRKFLESFIIIPKEMMRFEIEIKNWISQEVRRGQVTVRITKSMEMQNIQDVLPDEKVISKLLNSWSVIAKNLKLDQSQINIPFLANQMQLLTISEEIKDQEELREFLKKGFNDALKKMIEMKQKEGSILANDIQKRLKLIMQQIKIIKKSAPDAAVRLKQRLSKTVNEFVESSALDERILKEIAIYSDKLDITEEIIRFESHINQFTAVLSEKKGSVGRKMDFLIQEMVREINTIAAKSSEIKIAESVIVIKTELERIREQIQNVE